MSDDEIRTIVAIAALAVSATALVVSYLGFRRAQSAMRHSRKLAVQQLKSSIREQLASADAALDATSSRAQHLKARLDRTSARAPEVREDPDYAELEENLKNLEAVVDFHRTTSARILASVDVVGSSEANELALAKQLDSVTEISTVASGKAWEVDLAEYERQVSAFEGRASGLPPAQADPLRHASPRSA